MENPLDLGSRRGGDAIYRKKDRAAILRLARSPGHSSAQQDPMLGQPGTYPRLHVPGVSHGSHMTLVSIEL